MCMSWTLGHGTLDIGKEWDWRAEALSSLWTLNKKEQWKKQCFNLFLPLFTHIFFLRIHFFFFQFLLKMHLCTQICCSYTSFKSSPGTCFTSFPHVKLLFSGFCSAFRFFFLLWSQKCSNHFSLFMLLLNFAIYLPVNFFSFFIFILVCKIV